MTQPQAVPGVAVPPKHAPAVQVWVPLPFPPQSLPPLEPLRGAVPVVAQRRPAELSAAEVLRAVGAVLCLFAREAEEPAVPKGEPWAQVAEAEEELRPPPEPHGEQADPRSVARLHPDE